MFSRDTKILAKAKNETPYNQKLEIRFHSNLTSDASTASQIAFWNEK